MRVTLVSVLALCVSALPLSAALNFNNNLGTVGIDNTIFLFTPTGSTSPSPNYHFDYSPGATPIPNFRIINVPELPAFANANQKGGLVGLPLTSGPQSVSIRLTDGTGAFVDEVVTFTVQPVNLIGFGPFYYSIGDTVHQRFWPVGGTPPYTYTLTNGSLPPGLSLSTEPSTGAALVSGNILDTPNTATISGSVITNNQFNFTITITDSAGHSVGRGYSMAVSAMQLKVGGAPVNSGGNRTLPNATVGLAYNQVITVSGGTGPYTFSFPFLNALPNTLTMSQNGTSAIISGTPTAANFGGRFTLIVQDSATPPHYMTARLAIKILPQTPVPLAFSTNTIFDTPVGSNFTSGVYATGGLPPYTFDIDPATPVPPGVVLVPGPEAGPDSWDPDPGYLRLKVPIPGAYSFNLRVTDSAGNRVTRAFTLNVPSMSVNYIFASNTVGNGILADLTLGVPYSRYVIPIGGTPPYTITPTGYAQNSNQPLPAGLTVAPDANGAILLSGTPLEAGLNLQVNYNLNDSVGSHFDVPGNVTIASSTSPGLSLNGGDFGVARIGQQFAANLTVGGSAQNPPTFTVSLVSGTLPPGLSLLTGADFNNGGNFTAAAQLAGVPTTPGVYTFVYRVVDGLGQVGQRQVRLRVSGMEIVNQNIAPATVGVPYTQTIDLRGGIPPYTFSLTTGSLPSGLTLNPSTGTIFGTPTSTNSTGITIQVQDGSGDILLRSFTLNIYPIQITGPDLLPNGVFGQPYSYTFTPNPPGTYTFTASNLPFGLSFNSSTGSVSGTILTTGTFIVTVTAFNNATGAVVTRNFTLFVTSQSSLQVITGIPTSALTIGGVPTASLGDFLAGTNQVIVLNAIGGAPPYTISLAPGSNPLPPGMTLAIAATYQGTTNFNRWAIAGVPATPGLYTFTLRYADSAGITEDRVVALNITRLSLDSFNPGNAIVNQLYSAQLHGTGGTGVYTFEVTSDFQNNFMPPGLSLSPAGLITGTPTSTGSYAVTLKLSSGALARYATIAITINATSDNRRIDFFLGGPGPIYTFAGSTSNSFSTPTGGAGTHTWSIVAGSLPPGMRLSADGSITAKPGAGIVGAPSTPGTYSFRIRVDDSTGNFGIRDATYIVVPLRPIPVNALFFNTTQFLPGQVGVSYTFSVSALNAGPGLTWTQDPGTLLPPGMSFSSAGVLSGTPAAAGNFVLFGHVSDSSGNFYRFSTGLTIFPAGHPKGVLTAVSNGALLPSATVGGSYSLTLDDLVSPGYGNPSFTWTLNDGALPAGLQIVAGSGGSSATLSGTATTPGSYTFSLLVTDAAGNQALIKNLFMIVSVLGVSPPPGTLPPATAGVSYQTSITASGGTPGYTFTTEFDSDMPPGLSLSPGGVLSGVPNIAGQFQLFIIATDNAGATFRQRYILKVSPAGTVLPALVLTPASISILYTKGDPAPAPIPISVASTATPLSYTISAGNLSWLSSSAAGGTTPGAPNAIITPGSLNTGTYNGTLTFTSTAASNSPANLPVTLTVVNAVVCSFSLSQTAATIGAAGGNQSFSISVGVPPSPSCGWSVDTASLPAWIHLTSPGSGAGNGTINFSVDANASPAQRSGTIAVNGIGYTLTQFGSACSFTLTPQIVNIGAAGGSGPIGVIASSASCVWNFAQVDPWISVTATLPNPPKGSGSANVQFQANPLATSRTGTVTIAGQTLTVNQAGTACTFSLNSGGTLVSSAGGAASFNVTVPAGCTWTADTGPSWVNAVSGTPGSGNGTVNLNLAPNSTTTQRGATVKVAGQNFTITQAGVPCDFSLSANNPIQPMAGGNGSVAITTGGSCGWTASTNGANWVTPAANNGTGSFPLGFTVSANNTGAPRSATLTIAGQNITINQSGPACNYSLQSTSANVPGTGGAGSAGVITAAGCGPWTGSSNAPWLHFTGLASYSGPDSAPYSVDANLTGSDRFGTLTIAGQTFSVSQPAQACPVTLATSSLNGVGEFGGGPFQFTFTTAPPGCTVSIQSYSSWITISDLSTPGTVVLSVAPNTYASARSGSVMVGDQSFTVNQAPSTCAYTLASFARIPVFGFGGGTDGVSMSFAPAQCGPAPVIVNGPPGMITLGSVTGGAGSGTPLNYFQNYTVAIYLSFINYVRTAQLVVNGQVYTVKQQSW